MTSRKPVFYLLVLFSVLLNSFVYFPQQQNNAPIVKIILPQNNSWFDKEASVTYQISVSDKEDGDSKFEEINTKEVLLEARYLKNGKTQIPNAQNNAGLNAIMISNCVACHNFSTKGMGPSFLEISKRYPATKANTDSLIKRIKDGSTGIWGKEKMPAHPELAAIAIKNIVQWITRNSADPNVNYYVGTEGYFRIKPGAQSKGLYQLTASYTDHGPKDVAGTRLKGQDVIIIHIK